MCPSVLHYHLYSGGSEHDFPSNVKPTVGFSRFASVRLSKCRFHVQSNMFDHPLDTVSYIKFKITGEPYRVNKLYRVNNSLHAYIPTIVSWYCRIFFSPKRDCSFRVHASIIIVIMFRDLDSFFRFPFVFVSIISWSVFLLLLTVFYNIGITMPAVKWHNQFSTSAKIFRQKNQ